MRMPETTCVIASPGRGSASSVSRACRRHPQSVLSLVLWFLRRRTCARDPERLDRGAHVRARTASFRCSAFGVRSSVAPRWNTPKSRSTRVEPFQRAGGRVQDVNRRHLGERRRHGLQYGVRLGQPPGCSGWPMTW